MTATATVVPAVVRQEDPPPKMIPPPAVEREKMIAAAAATLGRHTPPSHISRAAHLQADEAARNTMQSPDPLPIPYRPRQIHHSPRRPHDEHEERESDRGHEHEHERNGGRDEHAARSRSRSPPGSNASARSASRSPRAAPQDELELTKVPSPQSTLVDAPQAAGTHREPGSPPSSNSSKGGPTTGQPLETIHEGPEAEDAAARHPLLRRRSSLKKKTSLHSLASQAKSVTWAMDRDWAEKAEKFVRVSNEAEVAGTLFLRVLDRTLVYSILCCHFACFRCALGYELEQSRAHYHEEIAMMRVVCQDVVRAAEKLGLVTDELKHESAALAVQQHKVATITEAMEQREARYKDAGTRRVSPCPSVN